MSESLKTKVNQSLTHIRISILKCECYVRAVPARCDLPVAASGTAINADRQ